MRSLQGCPTVLARPTGVRLGPGCRVLALGTDAPGDSAREWDCHDMPIQPSYNQEQTRHLEDHTPGWCSSGETSAPASCCASSPRWKNST